MNIFEKLSAVQQELNAPKKHHNGFGNYNYRKAEDILEAVKPIAAKYKALVACSDELLFFEGRHYIKATAIFIDIEKGDQFATSGFAREEESKKGMDGSQVTGASSSYARKYALNGLLAIDDTADSDTTNDSKQEQKPAPKPKQAAKPAPSPAPAPDTIAGMSKEAYWKTVAAAAQGKTTSDGQAIRDWWVAKCRPTAMELQRFDLDCENYAVAHQND